MKAKSKKSSRNKLWMIIVVIIAFVVIAISEQQNYRKSGEFLLSVEVPSPAYTFFVNEIRDTGKEYWYDLRIVGPSEVKKSGKRFVASFSMQSPEGFKLHQPRRYFISGVKKEFRYLFFIENSIVWTTDEEQMWEDAKVVYRH